MGSVVSKGGRGGGGGNNSAEKVQQRMAEELFADTDPLRKGLIDRSENILENPNDIFGQPGFAAVKDITESQFGRARENTIANTPAGGGLTQALGDLERARASDLVAGTARLNDVEIARAQQLATGTTGQSLAALGSSGAIQAQKEQAEAAQKAAVAEAIGSGAGAAAGSK